MEQLNLSFDERLVLLGVDEIYQNADQVLLTSLKEDRRLERKPGGIHGRALGEYFSMWANTVPEGGIIVVGQEDDGRFTGCQKLSQDGLNDLEKAGRVYCPDARSDSKRVPVIDVGGHENFVLVFRVSYREDKVVCDISGNAFTRVGDEKRRLGPDEIRELQIDKGQIDLEQEPTDLKYPEEFRADLIHAFAEGVRAVRKLTQGQTDAEILEHRRLGKFKGGIFIPNVACVLLFARDPNALFPGCSIRFLRYEGETEETGERYNVIKDFWLEGCIPDLIVEVANVLESQLREFRKLGDDGKFYTDPEYPREAWYEAIVNACVHRSYGLRNMNVFVKMFDDRLVVESPGAFPPFVTPDNIYNSQHPRNPNLMKAMFYLDFVKCHNEGTRRMRDAMEGRRLPLPQFEQKEVATGYMSVRVTLRNNRKQRKVWIDSDVTKFIPESMAKGLSQEETRVLNRVVEHGKINVNECHRLLPHIKTWHSVKKLLMRMTEKGLLIHRHRDDIERDPDACFVLPERPRENGKQT